MLKPARRYHPPRMGPLVHLLRKIGVSLEEANTAVQVLTTQPHHKILHVALSRSQLQRLRL